MSESKKIDRTAQYQTAGAGAMFLGIGVLTLILLDTIHALPWNLPRAWYVHKPLWGVVGLALCAAGWQLQRNRRAEDRTWKPGIAGRRFSRLIVYSRPECHLCDDAKAVLAGYIEHLPPIEEVDVDLDPALAERFGESIPVVEIDGVVRFRGRVDVLLLRRMIESTPPA
ncbi:MAG: glutaredoxin family protein [Planctomycetia bacterium]|nr:glutaredoxin family protein [Planctomycetia bacterium]